MGKLVSLIFLAAVGSCGCLAQSSGQTSCFEKANTQAAMTACASEEARLADDHLNEIYQKLLSSAGSRLDYIAKLKAAEIAWIAYRDAYMEAMYPAKNKQGEYGSIYPMEANLLRARLTLQQISALNDLLKQYSQPKP